MNDNANKGVIWEALDLWPVFIEWSSDESQQGKSDESMQSCAATWQAFSSQWALDFLRSQHSVTEGCAAASLSLAVMAASELSLAALQTGYLRAHHTSPVQAHRHHSCIVG